MQLCFEEGALTSSYGREFQYETVFGTKEYKYEAKG